jgi:two-component system chemotaxis response regulator CheB
MVQPTRVLIVDDSRMTRYVLEEILSRDESIKVIGTACDPYEARDKICTLCPDVVTLDVEMPRMNGIDFLKNLLQHKPLPVIMISSYTKHNSDLTIEALTLGAVDFITKPSKDPDTGLKRLSKEIIDKVKTAANSKVKVHQFSAYGVDYSSVRFPKDHFVVIGSSTGGIQAIEHILRNIPPTISGLVIAQHIPGKYVSSLAERLDNIATVRVKVAEHNGPIIPGMALIAPGGGHLCIRKETQDYYSIAVEKASSTDHYIPSIDCLFSSAASCAGMKAIGLLLTGMGQDGAKGMLALKQCGAYTIAQDRETSLVFGMPRAAIELKAATEVVSLDQIPKTIVTKLLSMKWGRTS